METSVGEKGPSLSGVHLLSIYATLKMSELLALNFTESPSHHYPNPFQSIRIDQPHTQMLRNWTWEDPTVGTRPSTLYPTTNIGYLEFLYQSLWKKTKHPLTPRDVVAGLQIS